MSQAKETNIILAGVGGQGQITLLRLLGEAALRSDLEIKSSELHGLSQKGGSVRVHLRMGDEIHAPLVAAGDADLVIALERQEALACARFASENTHFLINDVETPTMAETATKETVQNDLGEITDKVEFINAAKISKEELGNPIVAGVFLTSYACAKKLIPIEIKKLRKAIKDLMAEEHIDINLKAVDLGVEKVESK